MGSNPRTVRYFPRMKVRGKRRRKSEKWDVTMRALDRMAVSARAVGVAFDQLVSALSGFTWRGPTDPRAITAAFAGIKVQRRLRAGHFAVGGRTKAWQWGKHG